MWAPCWPHRPCFLGCYYVGQCPCWQIDDPIFSYLISQNSWCHWPALTTTLINPMSDKKLSQTVIIYQNINCRDTTIVLISCTTHNMMHWGNISDIKLWVIRSVVDYQFLDMNSITEKPQHFKFASVIRIECMKHKKYDNKSIHEWPKGFFKREEFYDYPYHWRHMASLD